MSDRDTAGTKLECDGAQKLHEELLLVYGPRRQVGESQVEFIKRLSDQYYISADAVQEILNA